MSRDSISEKTIDEILEQVQKDKANSPAAPKASDSEVDSILASLGIEDTPRERPHIQFTSTAQVDAVISGVTAPSDIKMPPLQPLRPLNPQPQQPAPTPAHPAQPTPQAPQTPRRIDFSQPLPQAPQPARQNAPAPIYNDPIIQTQQPVQQSAPRRAVPVVNTRAQTPNYNQNLNQNSAEHEETSTLELPTIKAYTSAQEQREEEIKQKAARDALMRAGVNPEPYAPAPEPYNAGQYQDYTAQPKSTPKAIRSDYQPIVPGAKTAPEQIGNAMFGEVDDRFKSFFQNSVAQDSREAEQEAYNRQKQHKKRSGIQRFFTSFIRDPDETFLTGEFTAQLPKKYEKIPIEVTLTQDIVVPPEQNAAQGKGAKIKDYTINMPIGGAPQGGYSAPRAGGVPYTPQKGGSHAADHTDEGYKNTDYLATETSEYNSVTDAPAVTATLKNMRVTRIMRLVLTGLITLVLFYFGFSARTGGLPAIASFDPHFEPFAFLTVNFILLSIAMLTCLTTLGTGVIGLFRRPTTDTFIAVATIAAFVQNLVYMFASGSFDPETTTIFAPVATFLLFANTLGKWLQSKVVSDNFEVASAEYRHSAAFMVQNEELARKLCSGIGEPSPRLLLSRPTDLVRHFLRQSFSQHKSDLGAKGYAYVMITAGVLCGLMCGLRTESFIEGISGFTAALCVAAPLASTLVYAMPALLLQQEAAAVKAVIPGPSAITELGETNVVLLNGRDLFPASCVRMHSIVPFEKARLDLIMIYGASIINRCCDTLRTPFMALVDNKEATLYKVENPQFEAGLGYVAWVDGKRIIMGSRAMMQRHSIEIPSTEYEAKHTHDGQRSPIYIAVAGKAYGMFIVSYTPDAEAQASLDLLGEAGINVILQTDDFNITGTLVGATYNLHKTAVKVLSQAESSLLASQTAYAHSTDGIMIHNGTCASFLGGLHAAARAASNEAMSTTIQTAAILFSLGMCIVLSFSNGLTGLALLAAVLYHIGWCALTAALPILFKRK